MTRTICYIPTTLTGHELEARLMMFLQYHKFKKQKYWGEELYKIGGWLWRPGYLKFIPEDGFLYVEAFYLYKHLQEKSIDTTFPNDPYKLREKLFELSKVVGTGPPMNNPPVAATMVAAEQADGPTQQPYHPESNPPDPSVPFDPWQQSSAGQQNMEGTSSTRRGCLKGCLIGCLVLFVLFFCFIGGCMLLVLLFPEPEEPEDSIAKKRQVGTLTWKMLREDRYSFEYPKEWTLDAKDQKKAADLQNAFDWQQSGDLRNLLSGRQPETVDGALGFVFCVENGGLYDELTEENSRDRLFGGNFRDFTCDAFEKGPARGKRAMFALYSGELGAKKYKIHYWLSENGDTIVKFWFIANDADDEQYQPVFDTILSTLRLK